MSEVTSLLFEKLFRDFLEKKNIYKEEIMHFDLEEHLYFLNNISISKLLCDLFNASFIKITDIYTLSYETAFSKEELLDMIRDDCGYIFSNKLDLSLKEFHYAIGMLIASHFIKKIREDFKNGWREFKDFICLSNYLSIEDILDNYLDIDSKKEDIKKYMKSYRGR